MNFLVLILFNVQNTCNPPSALLDYDDTNKLPAQVFISMGSRPNVKVSMTQLLTHIVAHSTRLPLVPKPIPS